MTAIEGIKFYYEHFDWRYTGERWASRWGDSGTQWFGTILPRIRSFLPAETALEIGPGRGRITRYLRPHARKLILTDVAEPCIEKCRSEFAADDGIHCYLTNGQDFGPVGDASVDFVFSFFSLVHADAETMAGYVSDLGRILAPGGIAFLHHSNGASCLGDVADVNAFSHYRDISVDADVVNELCLDAGLTCRSQEMFGWDCQDKLTDCFSVIARSTRRRSPERIVVRNWQFAEEIERLWILHQAYA